jgi:hypothetical protein
MSDSLAKMIRSHYSLPVKKAGTGENGYAAIIGTQKRNAEARAKGAANDSRGGVDEDTINNLGDKIAAKFHPHHPDFKKGGNQ